MQSSKIKISASTSNHLTPDAYAVTGSIEFPLYSLLRGDKCLLSTPVSKLDVERINLDNCFRFESFDVSSFYAALIKFSAGPTIVTLS